MSNLSKFFVGMFLMTSFFRANAQNAPVISNISPTKASIGSIISIMGSGFSEDLSSNTVYFGSVYGNIISASPSEIKAIVPIGADYNHITVTNLQNNATAMSSMKFLPLSKTMPMNENTEIFEPAPISLSHAINTMLVADLDGNGNTEYVFLSKSSNQILINRKIQNKNTDGSMITPEFQLIKNLYASSPDDIKMGDMNGDGRMDFVTYNSSKDSIYIYINNCTEGVINFKAPIQFQTGKTPNSIALRDMNGDGKMDIISANSQDNNFSIFENTSSASTITFNVHTTTFDNSQVFTPHNVSLFDLNKDGLPEIIASGTNATNSFVFIYENTSTSLSINFNLKESFLNLSTELVSSMAFADLNKDEKADIIIAYNNAPYFKIIPNTSENKELILGEVIQISSGNISQIQVADLDGNGYPELLAIVNQNQLAVYPNKSFGQLTNGIFGNAITMQGSENFMGMIAADFNNDTKVDVMLWFEYGFENTLEVLTNKLQSKTNVLSGNYTVGNSGNYPTVTAAIAALNNVGINGSVTFELLNGTYNERITLMEVRGADVHNTITFRSQSNNAEACKFSYASTNQSLMNYLLKWDGAKYFNFENIGFERTGNYNFAKMIQIENGASYNFMRACQFVGIETTIFNNNANLIEMTDASSYNSFINNQLQFGNIAFNLKGTAALPQKNNLFSGNIIDGSFSNYLRAEYNNAIQIDQNKMYNLVSNKGVGVYLNVCNDSIRVSNNIINSPNSILTGLQVLNCKASKESEGLFANNVVSVYATASAMSFSNSEYQRVYNNSVAELISAGGFAFEYNGGNFKAFNNVFYHVGSGLAIKLLNPLYVSNYNLFYTNGGILGNYNNTNFTDLEAWKTGTQQDMKSISGNPYTELDMTLVPNEYDENSWLLNGMGVQLPAENGTDINGNLRSQNVANGAVDLGAYEFRPKVQPKALVIENIEMGKEYQLNFGGRNVMQVRFDSAQSLPTALNLVFYPGEKAPDMEAGINHFDCFWKVEPIGGTKYYYSVILNYDSTQVGKTSRLSVRATSRYVFYPLWRLESTFQPETYLELNKQASPFYFTGTDDIRPVPVTWLDFTATAVNGKNVELKWSTGSEINNDYFEIQRSTDGKHWKALSKIQGAHWSSTEQSYNYIDLPKEGIQKVIYYRIKQVDFNGEYEYSAIRKVQFNSNTIQELHYWYNQSEQKTALSFISPVSGSFQVVVYDMAGKKCVERLFEINQGSNDLAIDMNTLKPGMYILSLNHLEFSKRIKMEKF